MTTPYSEAGGFWRSRNDAPAPDAQFHFFPAMIGDHGRTVQPGHGFSCHACVLRRESRGTVRLASRDVRTAPAIDLHLLDDPRDLATLRAGVRIVHRIVGIAPLQRFAAVPLHAIDVDDDATLDDHIQRHADTIYHSVGSCRMGSDEGAVVDPRLGVRGLERL